MEQLESNSNNNNQPYPPLRRPRTREDFYLFCKIILEHENYEMLEDLRETAQSPMNSEGSTKSESTTSSAPEFKSISSGSEDSVCSTNLITAIQNDVDSDSYNLITCFCGKPYAKRPMIECSKCLTWLHLTCAKVKRNNIPDVFYCYKCKLTMGLSSSKHKTGTKRESVDSYVSSNNSNQENTSNNHDRIIRQRTSL